MENIAHLVDKQPKLRDMLVRIGEIASHHKKEVYPVGGIVRDLLEEREIKEVQYEGTYIFNENYL